MTQLNLRIAASPLSVPGPFRLESVRKMWIVRGLTRQGINKNTGRLKQIFRWTSSKELVPVEVYQRLALVESMQMYPTPGVAEAPDEQGVSLDIVEKTIPHG